jgi:hypothetical protein
VDWFRNDCRRDGSGAQGCVRNDIHAQDRFRVCQQTVFIEQKKNPNLQAVSQNRIISTPVQVLRTFYPKLALPLREKKTLKIKT